VVRDHRSSFVGITHAETRLPGRLMHVLPLGLASSSRSKPSQLASSAGGPRRQPIFEIGQAAFAAAALFARVIAVIFHCRVVETPK
jgi:hypothetical protein